MSIANDIKIAKVCQVLALRDIEKGRERDLKLGRKIYGARKGVEWLNANSPSDSTLLGKQGYMVAMCGKYASEARGILALGATGQNISAIYGNGSVLMPYPINVVVSAGQSGVSTISNLAWVGLQGITDVVINGNPLQSSVGFTFNSATGIFDFSLGSYVLQTGDVITSLGFKTVASTGTSSTPSTFPTTIYVPATAGLVVTIPALVGKTIGLLIRGGSGVTVITSGAIVNDQVKFDSSVGTLTVNSGWDWVAGENLIIQYY